MISKLKFTQSLACFFFKHHTPYIKVSINSDYINVFKAVRRGVASDYRLILRRLKREARRRLMNFKK
jgi:hypothetical protein